MCYNCGMLGYMARDCRAPKNNHRLEVICHNCGKRGHLAKDCRAPCGGTYGQSTQGQEMNQRPLPQNFQMKFQSQ